MNSLPKLIREISEQDVGRISTFEVQVFDIQQTTGPTLFFFVDGTGKVTAKAFVGPGQRAFPKLNPGDVIHARVALTQVFPTFEGTFQGFTPLEGNDRAMALQVIQERMDERTEPEQTTFLIPSPVLDSLRPHILQAVKVIRYAIIESRPILLRHHADCDGYCGALALEQAILPQIKKEHGEDALRKRLWRRIPSKTPFYDYTDALKDITSSLTDAQRLRTKPPLVIVVDNGSTQDDLFALQKLRLYGCQLLVVDHHDPGKIVEGKALVDAFLDAHVNPYLVGGNKQLTAGMLCTEIGRWISKNTQIPAFLPALCGIADRSTGPEFQAYLKRAYEAGYVPQYLEDLATCVDFEASYLKYLESSLIDDLLMSPLPTQQSFLLHLKKEIEIRKQQYLALFQHYLRVEHRQAFILGKLDLELIDVRGEWPSRGKITGMAFRFLSNKYQKEGQGEKLLVPIVLLGVGNTSITIRATEGTAFNLNTMIYEMKKRFPYAMIHGGGHDVAGTLIFIEAAKPEITSFIDTYLNAFFSV